MLSALSFIPAMALMLVPINRPLLWLRPEFLSVLLIYWCLGSNIEFPIIAAFVLGLCYDLLTANLLGSSSLILCVIASVALGFKNRTKVYSSWQRLLLVFALIFLQHLLRYWLQFMQGAKPHWLYWLAPITSLMLWPVYSLMFSNYKPENIST